MKIKSIENQLASEETLDVRVQLWNKKQSINNKLSPLYDRVKSKESIIHKYSSIVLTILIVTEPLHHCRDVIVVINRNCVVLFSFLLTDKRQWLSCHQLTLSGH
jgi:hypothetical protein